MLIYIRYRIELRKLYTQNWLGIMHSSCLNYKNPCLLNTEHFQSFFSTKDNSKEKASLEESLATANKEDYIENHLLEQLRRKRLGQDLLEIAKTLKEYEHLQMEDTQQIWVGVAMAKPGKNTYLVKYKNPSFEDSFSSSDADSADSPSNSRNSYSYSFHTCLVTPRDQEMPLIVKRPYNQIKKAKEARFCKEDTVFANWVEDDDKLLKACFQHDMEQITLEVFIRDSHDLKECERLIFVNYPVLKKIFIVQASRSNFPCIEWTRFQAYCKECDLVDSVLTLDKLFIMFENSNAGVPKKKSENGSQTALKRFEFIEMLFRVVQLKYMETQLCEQFHEGFELLMNEHILKNQAQDMWQEFRDKYLWQTNVCNLVHGNRNYLKRIFDSQAKKNENLRSESLEPQTASSQQANSSKNFIPLPIVMDFLTNRSKLSISREDAMYCYGMSKMSVINEGQSSEIQEYNCSGRVIIQSKHSYHQMKFTEFLEMLGRISWLYYSQNFNPDGTSKHGAENFQFIAYVEFVMEHMIHRFLYREIVTSDDTIREFESASDEEY